VLNCQRPIQYYLPSVGKLQSVVNGQFNITFSENQLNVLLLSVCWKIIPRVLSWAKSMCTLLLQESRTHSPAMLRM